MLGSRHLRQAGWSVDQYGPGTEDQSNAWSVILAAAIGWTEAMFKKKKDEDRRNAFAGGKQISWGA